MPSKKPQLTSGNDDVAVAAANTDGIDHAYDYDNYSMASSKSSASSVLSTASSVVETSATTSSAASRRPSQHLSVGLRNDAIQVAHNDVLSGRGGLANKHPGNQMFRRIVNENKALYQNCQKKTHKHFLAVSIITAIERQGGRFLKKEGGRWVHSTRKEAFAKTSQALREQDGKIVRRSIVLDVDARQQQHEHETDRKPPATNRHDTQDRSDGEHDLNHRHRQKRQLTDNGESTPMQHAASKRIRHFQQDIVASHPHHSSATSKSLSPQPLSSSSLSAAAAPVTVTATELPATTAPSHPSGSSDPMPAFPPFPQFGHGAAVNGCGIGNSTASCNRTRPGLHPQRQRQKSNAFPSSITPERPHVILTADVGVPYEPGAPLHNDSDNHNECDDTSTYQSTFFSDHMVHPDGQNNRTLSDDHDRITLFSKDLDPFLLDDQFNATP